MTPENDKSRQTRQKAVALRYDADGAAAPRVTAKGQGYLAERIVALADEHGVFVEEDPDLVHLLAQLDVGAEIPESLYRAVAEVLAFVYRLGKEGFGE